MEYNETQYERVARWFDGEAIELTTDEQALVDEMRRLENVAGGLLDVTVPDTAVESARWRLRSEPAADRPARTRRGWWVGVAAAAATVLFAAGVWMMTPTARPTGNGKDDTVTVDEAEVYQDVVAATSTDTLSVDIELMDDDVAELESELFAVMDEPADAFPDTDAAIEATGDQIDEISTYDPFEGLGG
ncbi:MAG: hypothetical protein ACLFVH_14240 [Phycisphaerae bacterium]